MDWLWSPPGITACWLVLHAADYLLTIAGARARRTSDLPHRLALGGSYELNPVFRAAVDRGAWLSRRFLVSLAVPAILLPFAVAWISSAAAALGDPVLERFPEALCGALVVSRLTVVAAHLQNLLLFHRMLRVPAAAVVALRYDRGTVFALRRARVLETAAVTAVGAAVTGGPFLIGGSAAMLLLAATLGLWARADARAPSPAATSG